MLTRKSEAAASEQLNRAPAMAPVRGQRRPWLLAGGALIALIGALFVVWIVGSASDRQSVVAVTRAVPYGSTITEDDLTVTRLSVGSGVKAVPAARIDSIVGQVATTELVAGMLLPANAVAPAGEPGPGRVLVPLAVPAERMPAGGLLAGDRLLVVDADADRPVPTSATVVRVGETDANGTTVVDVTVADAQGAGLAVAAAKGHIALIVQPAGR